MKKFKLSPGQRNLGLSVALISILVVLSVFNQTLFAPLKSTSPLTHQSRGIASVEGMNEDVNQQEMNRQAQTAWEYKLAKQVAQDETPSDPARDTASIGQLPSPIEQFRFGFLENKYQFNFKDGKVSGFHFPETSPDRPKYIKGGEAFLVDHAGLFAVNFKAATMANKRALNDQVTETFDLVDADAKPVGHATVVTDKYGRLLSVDVNSL